MKIIYVKKADIIPGTPQIFSEYCLVLGFTIRETAVNFPSEEIAASALRLTPLDFQRKTRNHARSPSERISLTANPRSLNYVKAIYNPFL